MADFLLLCGVILLLYKVGEQFLVSASRRRFKREANPGCLRVGLLMVLGLVLILGIVIMSGMISGVVEEW